jgi:hypothetical protein
MTTPFPSPDPATDAGICAIVPLHRDSQGEGECQHGKSAVGKFVLLESHSVRTECSFKRIQLGSTNRRLLALF